MYHSPNFLAPILNNRMSATDEASAMATRQHGAPKRKLVCNTLRLRRQTESASESSRESESESSETEVDESSGDKRSNSQEHLEVRATAKSASEQTLHLTQAQYLLKTQIDELREGLEERQKSVGPSYASGEAAQNGTSWAAKKSASLAAFTARNSHSQKSFDSSYKTLEAFARLALTGEGLDSGQRFRRANDYLTSLQRSCLGGDLTRDSPDFTEADYMLEARIAALGHTALRITLGDELEGTGSIEELYAECDELDKKIAFCPSRELLQSLTGYDFAVPTWDRSQQDPPAQVDRLCSHGRFRDYTYGEESGSVAPVLT